MASQRIPDSVIEQIRSRVSAVEIAGQLGIVLKPEGSAFKALCPFHDEHTPSFAVYPGDRGWHCFGCGESGDAIDLLQRLSGQSFPDAVRELADRLGIPILERSGTPSPQRLSQTSTSRSAATGGDEPPASAGRHKIADLRHLWPYDRAKAVYAYPIRDGGVAHEVRFADPKSGKKRSILCRPTEWGLVYGIRAGEYFQSTDGCWRQVNAKTPPKAPRKQIPGAQLGLYRPEVIARARRGEDWIFSVEGPKDAETAIGLGLLATTSPNGASGMRAYHAEELRGHRVVLVGDHDVAGEKGVKKRSKLLDGVASEVRVLPPLGGDLGSGFDLTDWVTLNRKSGQSDSGMVEMLLAMVEKATDQPAKKLPIVEITTREREVADHALQAVVDRENNFFQRGGAVVHVVRTQLDEQDGRALLQRPVGSPIIRAMPEARMRELLSEHCAFVTCSNGKDGDTNIDPAHPPAWCARALLKRGEWRRVPRLEAVVEGPILRADGSVLQSPGYDAATGVLYVPNARFAPVPDQPTARDVETARKLLEEVVCDFPFRTEEHFTAWLSALLTPLARFAFWGPSPLNMIDANIRGAGKSLLADVCTMIFTGRPAARMSYHRNEEELRKAITSLALSGAQTVLIDNINGRFGDATLDRALTATIWRDRLLGTNEEVEMPLVVTWYGSGNNVVLGADTTRRCLHIRLESPEENPEERTEFRHPRLLEWVSKERHRILPAALTLLRGYWAAGQPRQRLPGWGSFEPWSDIVRQCLAWIGLPDPGGNARGSKGVGRCRGRGLGRIGARLGRASRRAPPGGRGGRRRDPPGLGQGTGRELPRLAGSSQRIGASAQARGAADSKEVGLPPSPLSGSIRPWCVPPQDTDRQARELLVGPAAPMTCRASTRCLDRQEAARRKLGGLKSVVVKSVMSVMFPPRAFLQISTNPPVFPILLVRVG